jgi:hypothetical protein
MDRAGADGLFGRARRGERDRFMSKLQSWIRALVIVMAAVVSLAAISPAMAAKVHLKDGKVLEGRVKREAEEFIVFVV